jgi:PAS domain S-box-containing protein
MLEGFNSSATPNPNSPTAILLGGLAGSAALGLAIGTATTALAGVIVGLATGLLAVLFAYVVQQRRISALLRTLQVNQSGASQPALQEELERALKAQEELNKVVDRLKVAMNAAGVSMWEWNIKSDKARVMEGSAFVERLGGRTEYVGREYIYDTLHPDDRAGWEPMFTAAIMAPPGEDTFGCRYRAIYPDGSLHWIQMHARVLRTSSGIPRAVLGVDWDVTKEVLAAQEVAAQAQRIADGEARLLRAVSGTSDALFDLHADSNLSWIAPRFYSLLGYDESEFELNSAWWNSLVHPEDQPRRAQVIQAHLSQSTPFDVEYRLRKKNGEWLWVRARGVASPERDAQGRPLRFSGGVQDISHERGTREELILAKQAAEEASRAKSAFLATMSHEIRTPMNGIIGMTTLLLDSTLNGLQRDYAEMVLASADSLLKILNDILDFSKIEAGKLEIESLEMDLVATIEDIASLMSFQCAAKNVELIVNIRPEVPEWVVGDQQRIRQCLLNLVSNAIKFTQQGEVVIDVLAVGQQNGKTIVQFEVRDTGLGIEEHIVGTLFRPFTQADSSTTRRFGGTGLGLSIVHRLVELMGGQVGVASQPGKGSLFWFTLPLIAADSKTTDQPNVAVETTHRVLLVDDNETNRQVLIGQLRQSGYEVESAASGLEALAIMRSQEHLPFDLVLLDFEMPGMDGATLGEQIMADLTLSRTRLIMLTSLDRSGDMQRFAEIGFAAYLAKPIRHRELLRCLHKVLGYEVNVWQTRSQPMVTRGNLLSSDGASYQGRVLLVEDNVINQRVASRFLERLGCAVEIAADGVHAVAAFERSNYDIVLMDMQMPVMDGLEATRRIRDVELRKGQVRTPIVALTANAMSGQMERCLEAGMDDYLTKPLDIERLHATLDRYLGKHPQLSTNIAGDGASGGDQRAQIAARLQEVAGDDVEFARELVDAYLGSGASIVGELRSAFVAADIKAIGQSAHKLKGASSNLHLSELASLAHEIELRAKAGDETLAQTAQRDMALVTREFERVCTLLRQVIESAPETQRIADRGK